jgi:hypothetical protein
MFSGARTIGRLSEVLFSGLFSLFGKNGCIADNLRGVTGSTPSSFAINDFSSGRFARFREIALDN